MILDYLRFVLGFISLIMLCALIAIIALGKVEEHTSYGPQPLVVALNSVSILFAQWAFSHRNGGTKYGKIEAEAESQSRSGDESGK